MEGGSSYYWCIPLPSNRRRSFNMIFFSSSSLVMASIDKGAAAPVGATLCIFVC